MSVCTARGDEPENPRSAPTPTNRTLPDGQKADHWTMCPTEIMKEGYKRPVRLTYVHVGLPGPKHPLRDLTDDQKRRYGETDYVKFEPYPEGSASVGRFWTQAEIDKIDKGCGVQTRMPQGCAETYAANPGYYGSTFCCGCGKYLPVGARGEFIWDDGSNERVGT